MKSEAPILRHGVTERMVHWVIAIVFTFLFLSGLALFHPVFFWLAGFFGGGPFMRWLHPVAGVILSAAFAWYAAKLVRDNRWLPADSAWVENMWRYMRKEHEPADTHKYNAGQKMMYWSMVPIIGILFLTGIVLWQPAFAFDAASRATFGAGLRRFAGLAHAACAFVMFIGIGVHVYAAFWTKGSIRSMVRGTVSAAWARFHHPAWYREVSGGGAEEPERARAQGGR
ncbi:MAG: formate dehydrogenase subunit gamma [Anaeromyxobacter sp.]